MYLFCTFVFLILVTVPFLFLFTHKRTNARTHEHLTIQDNMNHDLTMILDNTLASVGSQGGHVIGHYKPDTDTQAETKDPLILGS